MKKIECAFFCAFVFFGRGEGPKSKGIGGGVEDVDEVMYVWLLGCWVACDKIGSGKEVVILCWRGGEDSRRGPSLE